MNHAIKMDFFINVSTAAIDLIEGGERNDCDVGILSR